jgi:hypothetical protein
LSHNQLPDIAAGLMARMAALLLLLVAPCTATGTQAIDAGDRGFGLTVMQGTRIDTFDVEVLGVERGGFLPGRERVIVRLSGLGLETSGILQGMSGSPVYLDGRLIGAVAYAWSFSKEPIGLVTPIADMLEILDHDLSGRGSRNEDDSGQAPSGWQRLTTPLWLSGGGPATREFLGELLAEKGWDVVEGAGGGAAADDVVPLRPGSAAAVPFITGDLTLAGIGTVTWVGGDRVLAFGHDMIGSGTIDVPLAAAHIHGAMPSTATSFKLGSATRILGAIRQDRFPGIAGVLGAQAPMLPVGVEVRTAQGARRFAFEVARHRFYTTGLAQTALLGAIESAGKGIGAASLRLELAIELADGRRLEWRRVFTGLSAPMRAAIEAGQPIVQLVESEFPDADVAGIEARVVIDEAIHSTRIDAVTLDRPRAHPGELVDVRVDLRPLYRGEVRQIRVPLRLPDDAVPGEVVVRVASGRVADGWEEQRLERSPPATAAQLLEQLGRPVLDDELVVEVVAATPGLAVRGQELPSPPPSVRRLLGGAPSATHTRPVAARVLVRQRLPTGSILQGEHALPLTIERERR